MKWNHLLLSGLVVTLVAGCGGNAAGTDSPSSTIDTGKSGEGAIGKTEPVELVVFHPWPKDWPEEDFWETFGNPLKERFPHVTLKYIVGGNIQEIIAGGQRIDLIFSSLGATVAYLLNAKLEYDISPQIKAYQYDLSRLDRSMVDAVRQMADGEIYGLPVFTPPSATYYNKDLFDKFGLGYPKDNMTWDDAYEISKRLNRTDGGITYYGLGASYGHIALMNQLSIPLVDPKTGRATYDTDARWKNFTENLIRFYRLPGFSETTQLSEPHERNRFFKDRTVGMFLSLTALHNETEILDMNFDIANFPYFADKPGVGPQPNPTYFYVTSTSDHKDQAFELISFLTTKEYQLEQIKKGKFLTPLADSGVRVQFGEQHGLYKGKNVKAMQPEKYAAPAAFDKYGVSGQYNTGFRGLVSGNAKDINTMLREAAEAANKKIAEAEARK